MRKGIILLLTVFIMSCNSDDTSLSTNKKDIDIITGISIRGIFVPEVITVGNPNNFIDYEKISIFPNPAIDALKIENLINEQITDVWFVKCNPNKDYKTKNFNSILNSNLYSVSNIESNSGLKFNNLVGNNFVVNLEDVDHGYYKVFVNSNEIIYWDNIYIMKNNETFDDIVEFWK